MLTLSIEIYDRASALRCKKALPNFQLNPLDEVNKVCD